MQQVPDAPYIREAENDGWLTDEPVKCPICGEECETVYLDRYGNVFACEHCLDEQDARDWHNEELERGRPE